jgi:hypothetical protein
VPVAISYAAGTSELVGVAMVGHVAYFAVASGLSAQDGVGYEGIYVEGVTDQGVETGYQTADADALDVALISLAADDQGRLLLSSTNSAGDLRVLGRELDGGWDPPAVVASGVDGLTAAASGQSVWLLYTSSGQLHARSNDGQVEDAAGAPSACVGPVWATRVLGPDHDLLSFTLACGGTLYLGLFDPGLDAGRWRYVPAPASCPLYGLEGGDPQPLAQVRPAGGRADAPLFQGFTPDAPGVLQAGGYNDTFWLEPDGGFAFSSIGYADNGYSLVQMVVTAGPAGSPLAAYDTVVTPDAGSPVQGASLLIEAYFP